MRKTQQARQVPQVPRDKNILKNYQGEINLQTKVVKDKSKYTRKVKHKLKFKDYES